MDADLVTATDRLDNLRNRPASRLVRRPLVYEDQGHRRTPRDSLPNTPFNNDKHDGDDTEFFDEANGTMLEDELPAAVPQTGVTDSTVAGGNVHVTVGANRPAPKAGLSFGHICDFDPHVWLIHQADGCPARVRLLSSLDALYKVLADTNVVLPTRRLRRAERKGRRLTNTTSAVPAESKGSMMSPVPTDVHDATMVGVRDETTMLFQQMSKDQGSTTTDTSSSRSSSSSLRADEHDMYWLDIQTSDTDAVRDLLMHRLEVSQSTADNIVYLETVDRMEYFPSLGLVHVNLGCRPWTQGSTGPVRTLSGLRKRNHHVTNSSSSYHPNDSVNASQMASFATNTTAASSDDANEKSVVVACLVYENWMITIHEEPFVELAELVRRIQVEFSLKRRSKQDESHHRHRTRHARMRPAWIMSTLTDLVVEEFLPDPTPIFLDVDRLDEEAMIVMNMEDQHEQRQLMRRIAALRRSIAVQRTHVNNKLFLLTQLLLPAMRSTFLAKRSSDCDVYVFAQDQLMNTADKLDTARDLLQTANSNFAAGMAVRMARSSHIMDNRMHGMAQITLICLPPSLVGGLWGMNVQVPFETAADVPVVAFFVIIGCMVGWLLLNLRPMLRIYSLSHKKVPWKPSA